MKDLITEFVREYTPLAEVPPISEDTRLIDDLEYDSLCIISLFEEIERKFGINCMIYDDMYEALLNVGNLIRFVEKRCLSGGEKIEE